MKKTLKGKALEYNNFIVIEFGRTQAVMNFSANGTIQRKLKLKDNDKVLITIEKV